VTDLPLSGRIVQLMVIARRFRCEAVLSGRQIFTERFPDGVLASSARRTTRLDCIVHHLGLALGGRPAASLARPLMLPVSNGFTVHPTIAVVARDRSGGYGEAAAKALPHTVQVADRWHLMENVSRAFLDAVRKSMRQIRSAIGATTINPVHLTAAERIQYEGYLRREEAMRPSWPWRKMECRSNRSCARPATAGGWCGK
jgi:transposase